MIPSHRPKATDRRASWSRLAPWLVAAMAAPGCHHSGKAEVKSVSKPPTVRVTHPEVRDIVRRVGQPSFVESYERTSIYPKLTGYIEKWNVDIGDKVKKGDVLAILFVPELKEDFGTKKATVKLDEERIRLAEELVEVADAEVKSAKAALDEARAILAKYQAEVDRWDTEVKRLDAEVKRGVVVPQILLESTNQWKAALASRDAATSTIAREEAELLSKKATLSKAKVDVSVAKADLAVATSEARRIEAWVGYINLTAPYDGIVVARNANTGDFVVPSAGDPTANMRAPYLGPGGTSAPIYVVDRTDIVRIFVDIPERDANYVRVGNKASVLAKAYRDEPIPGSVTRTSWALNVKSRTLRAEIDLPNPGSQLLPGMYTYAKVIIDRPGVRALPASALVHRGEKTLCWTYRDGRSIQAEVRTGISDGEWVEVTNLLHPPSPGAEEEWTPITGKEEIILGDLTTLADGGKVEVAPPSSKGQVAAGTTSTADGSKQPEIGRPARPS